MIFGSPGNTSDKIMLYRVALATFDSIWSHSILFGAIAFELAHSENRWHFMHLLAVAAKPVKNFSQFIRQQNSNYKLTELRHSIVIAPRYCKFDFSIGP
jgi:hypothetical protein